jgi:hypothetical protein
MQLYRATFKGRHAGAIGISHVITTDVVADSPEHATLKLYDSYDHISGLKLTLEADYGDYEQSAEYFDRYIAGDR